MTANTVVIDWPDDAPAAALIYTEHRAPRGEWTRLADPVRIAPGESGEGDIFPGARFVIEQEAVDTGPELPLEGRPK